VGLIKPSLVIRWGTDKSRKRVAVIFGGAAVLSTMLLGITSALQDLDKIAQQTPAQQEQQKQPTENEQKAQPQIEVKKDNVIKTQPVDTFLVKRVIDGDTIELANGQRVRYIGIDTPETVDPRKPVQCFGVEASNRNKQLVEGKQVRLEKDVSETDKYGRLLRYVYVNGTFVNLVLVQDGFAYSSTYPPDIKYQNQFIEAQRVATEQEKGLWGSCPTTPTEPTPTPASSPIPLPSQSTSCTIKGNISDTNEKIYHVEGCSSYNKTKIDEARGEKWFCTEADAVAAGWRKALNCP